MRLRKRNTKNLLFALVVFILAFFSVFSYTELQSLINSTNLVNHSYLVSLKIEQAASAVKDAETAQRSYLVTGDARFLKPYEYYKNRAIKIFDSLQALVATDEVQTESIKKYKTVAFARLTHLDLTKTYRSSASYNTDTIKNLMFAGSAIMEQLRNQTEITMQTEQWLLSNDTKKNSRYRYFAPVVLLCIQILSLVIILVLFLVIRRRYILLRLIQDKLVATNESLEKQNKFSQAVIDSSVDVIGVLDSELRYINMNARAYEMYPAIKNKIIGRHVLDVFPDTKTSGTYSALLKVLELGEIVQQNNYHSPHSNRYYENFYIPIKNDNGVVQQVLAVGHDITAMVETNDRLKEANSILKRVNSELSNAKFFLQLVLDSSIDIITTLDLNLRFTSVNKKAIEAFKMQPEKLIGKHLIDINPLLSDQMQKNFSLALKGEMVREEMVSSSIFKGKYYEVYFIPLYNEGKVNGVLTLSRDLSDIINVQANLKVTNQLLSEAQHLAHIGSWEWNTTHNTIIWSDKLYNIYGVSKENFELSYDNYISHIYPDDRQLVNETIQNAYKNHIAYDMYHRIIRPGGEIRIIHGHGEVHVDNLGNTIKLSGTAQDVTEWKTAEAMLKQTTVELEQKNLELQRSNAELDSFSYIASHDLQEPLRKIQTFTNKIFEQEKGQLSEKATDYFTRIQSAAVRMRNLITALFNYSRLKTGEFEFIETNLTNIAKEVKKNLYDMIEEKNAFVEIDELPTLAVMPLQIEQLFSNLTDNALKYSRTNVKPCVKITAQFIKDYAPETGAPSANYWKISFIDNGIGFETFYNKKIFDLFSRLHSKKEYSGTGIGLAICKKVTENHKGFIIALGEPDNGARFDIYFPER